MLVTIDNAEPGMEIQTDVVLRGMTLIKAGTVLTDELIRSLRRWEIKNVRIKTENGETMEDAGQDEEDNRLRCERIESLFAPHSDTPDMMTLKESILTHLKGRNND